MSILGRKEIAQLKKELETSKLRFEKLESENLQLNEKCSRYQSALNQANKENEAYKRKYNELLGSVSAVASDDNNEYSKLQEQCDTYRLQLDNANREIANCKQDSLSFQNQINQIKADYEELEEILNLKKSSTDVDDNDTFYHIRNIVKKHYYYMDEVYCSKLDLFHSFKEDTKSREYEMYKLLLNIIFELKSEDLINTEGQNIKLSLFSQVRLADIVGLQCGTFDYFKKDANKKSICKMISEIKPDFDNNDYKKTFLYPILSSHIDFLVCLNGKTLCEPVLAIELHGKEHDKDSDKADNKRIWYDELKKALFESKKVNIELLVAKNNELDNEERKNSLKNKIREILIACLEKREDVLHI